MRNDLFASTAFIAAAALCAAPARAAEDEIVVTATRTPTPINDLPAQVTVIDADTARERGEVSLDQALAAVPGLQAPRTGPVGQQTSIFSGGFESNHTLVLFDGIRIDDPSTPEGTFDTGQDTLGDTQRIEVVQGPMSALYGSNALGGVINMLPRRGGPGAFSPRLEVAGGTFATLMANVGADGTLGRFRYAVNAEGYASGGYDIVPRRIATYTGERDGAEIGAVTGVFDFAVKDTLALDLLLRQRRANASYDPGLFGNIDENPQADVRQNDTALWRLGATWSPQAAFSLRLSGGALATDRVFADMGITGDEFHGRRQFADFAGTWTPGAWTLQFGGVDENETIDAVSFGAAVAGAQEHWGAYAGVQGGWGPLDLTAAVRHDTFEGFGGETTFRAGAAYHVTEQARVYASYGTGYRAPSLYELYVPFFGTPGLQPETSSGWEVGGDARFALFDQDDGLQLGALYRSSEIDDLIGFFGFSYANVDRADINFAEARISVHPLGWLTARASYDNTNARDAATNQALQRRPRNAWSAEVAVEHGPFSARLAWREVGARLDTVYDDLGFFAGTGRVESYDVVRASAAWAVSDAVKLYLAADNLLDAAYEPVNGFAGAPASLLFGVRVTPNAGARRH